MKQILLLIIAGVVVAGCCSTENGYNGYTVTLKETGSNVVATGRGAIDLTGLHFETTSSISQPAIGPAFGAIQTGPDPTIIDFYSVFKRFNGPASFGSGGAFQPNTGSGSGVVINANEGLLGVPHGYASGAALSSTSTWNNSTFISLGVTPGTYVWTWGNGENQSFTLKTFNRFWWLNSCYWYLHFRFPEWRSWPPPWPPPRDLPSPTSGHRVLAGHRELAK